jgi:hypothetical protein
VIRFGEDASESHGNGEADSVASVGRDDELNLVLGEI